MSVHFDKAYSYADVSLVPRVISEREHRDSDTSTQCFGISISIPMIASPMPDVCNGELAHELWSLGAFGIIHRFQSIEKQVEEYEYATQGFIKQTSYNSTAIVSQSFCGCAIGITDDWQERFKRLYEYGCRVFCLDVANGANVFVAKAIKWIRDYEKNDQKPMQMTYGKVGSVFINSNKIYLIAGNVATKEGYKFLADCGVDAVRVGIAGGSPCTTKTETGVYYPMVSSILECVEERKTLSLFFINGKKYKSNDIVNCVHKNDRNLVNELNFKDFVKNMMAKDVTEEYYLIEF